MPVSTTKIEGFTTEGAVQASRLGRIESWVHAFLQGEGGNQTFSDGLRKCPRAWFGPYSIPMDVVERCCGPEEGMKYKVVPKSFEQRVTAILDRIRSGWDVPPLIVEFAGGEFILNDGNHRHEALVRLKEPTVSVIIWTTGDEAAAVFLERFGRAWGRSLGGT